MINSLLPMNIYKLVDAKAYQQTNDEKEELLVDQNTFHCPTD